MSEEPDLQLTDASMNLARVELLMPEVHDEAIRRLGRPTTDAEVEAFNELRADLLRERIDPIPDLKAWMVRQGALNVAREVAAEATAAAIERGDLVRVMLPDGREGYKWTERGEARRRERNEARQREQEEG
jgi:hypothetical protein